jgi:uncharacterized protein YwbE
MARRSQRAKLQLSEKDLEKLHKIAHSRSKKLAHVQRAQIMLEYFGGTRVTDIAQKYRTIRPRVERIINKALQLGALSALDDLHRTGKPPEITPEAKAWFLSIACQKPKDLGLASETWTAASLAQYLRVNCEQTGHPSLSKVSNGTVSKILSKSEIHPERIEFYLERRDPDFNIKMAQVLHVYKEVEVLREQMAKGKEQVYAILSYDEKPGVEAIKNIAPELNPVLGQYPTFKRDYESVVSGYPIKRA